MLEWYQDGNALVNNENSARVHYNGLLVRFTAEDDSLTVEDLEQIIAKMREVQGDG